MKHQGLVLFCLLKVGEGSVFSIILVSEINCTICFLLHQMSIWFYRFTSRLLFRNIVSIWSCAKGGKFRKNSLATLETFEDWKTVLRGRANRRRGSATIRGNHNPERAFPISKSSAVTAQGSRGAKNRDVRSRGGPIEVMVVGVAVRDLGSGFESLLRPHLGLHDGAVLGVILGSGGVGVADAGSNLGDVVSVAWKNKHVRFGRI